MIRLRSALGVALGAALLALPTAASADAVFYRNQTMEVHGTGWSFAGVWNGSDWAEQEIAFGDYTYQYTILLNEWAGHFLYDFDTGSWTQSYWMLRTEL